MPNELPKDQTHPMNFPLKRKDFLLSSQIGYLTSSCLQCGTRTKTPPRARQPKENPTITIQDHTRKNSPHKLCITYPEITGQKRTTSRQTQDNSCFSKRVTHNKKPSPRPTRRNKKSPHTQRPVPEQNTG